MQYQLDPSLLRKIRNKAGETHRTGRGGASLLRAPAGAAGVAGLPVEAGIRDTVAGVAGCLPLAERTAAPPMGEPFFEERVLASVARDGKSFIEPGTVASPGATTRAVRHDVLAQR